MPSSKKHNRGIVSASGVAFTSQKLHEMKLTQKEFAERAGIGLRSLQHYLKKEKVDLDTIRRIAQALGVDEMDLIDPYGTRFLDWDAIRQNSLDQLPPLLSDRLVDRIGRNLDWSRDFVELTLHQRERLPSYRSILHPFEGSYLYELGANEIAATLTTRDFINQFLTLRETASPPSKHTVVVGATGTGKTTLLQEFVRAGLNHPDLTIIYIPLAESPNQSIEDSLDGWLKTVLKRDEGEVSELEKKALIGRFREKQVILLLDSGNEIIDARTRLDSLQHLLKSWVGLAHIVFTCRPNTWNVEQNPLNGKFEVYQLSPLHYGGIRQVDQVGQLIETRFKHNPALGVSLRAALNHPGQATLRDLVRNPLNLTILCYIWVRSESLPASLNQLYANFVRLICDYEGAPADPIDFSYEPLLQTAGILARCAIESSDPFRLTLSYIHQVFRVGGLDWNRFTQLKQTGLLHLIGTAQADSDKEIYAYLHPIVQSFLAAGVIESEDFFPKHPYGGDNRIFNPQLLEVYRLLLGRQDLDPRCKRELLQRLTNFDYGSEFYHYQAVFLAAAGLAEFYESAIAAPIIEQLRTWLDSGMESIRYGALSALQASQTAEGIAVIVEFVAANPNNLLSFQAITQLGLISKQHKTQAEAGLVELTQAEDLTIRFLAGESLIRLDPNDRQRLLRQIELLVLTPTPFLVQIYAKSFHPVDAEFAALYDDLYLPGSPPFQGQPSERLWRSIGRGNLIALDWLLERLSSQHPEFILQNAAIGLGELGLGQLPEVRALIQLIDRTEDEQTEEIATASLEKLGIDFLALMNALADQGIETLEVDQVVELAMAQLTPSREPQPEEDQMNLNDSERFLYFESLIHYWLQNPYNFEQRYKVRQSLSQIGARDPVLIQICLEQLIPNQDLTQRWLGATLLGEIGTGAAAEIQHLEQFLELEGFKPVRRAAARSLAQLLSKPDNGEQRLLESLDCAEDEEIGLWLAYQIGVSFSQSRQRAIEYLVHLIRNSPSFEDEFIYTEQIHNYPSVVKQASRQLRQLLSKEHAAIVVAGLNPCLSEQVREHEPERYRNSFDLLWECAHLISPTEFCQTGLP